MADVRSKYDEQTQLGLYRDKFTDSQRRRVEALVVARYLFPSAGPASQSQIANWIATGKWVQTT